MKHTHNWQYYAISAIRVPSGEPSLLRYKCECGLETIESSAVPAPANTDMTIDEFLRCRINDIRRGLMGIRMEKQMAVEAMLSSMERVLEFHEKFPMLIESDPEYSTLHVDGLTELKYRVTVQQEWLTRTEYMKRFGKEAPTAPILQDWLMFHSDHPHFNPEWKTNAP